MTNRLPPALSPALSLFLALAIAVTAAIGAPAALAAGANWNATFADTAAGHRVGNPEAPTSLIVFASYSCPHCARFEQQSDAPLRAGYIHGGKLSVEVRQIIRNPIDLAAALATECGEPADFFARHRAMMMAQDEWLEAARSATREQQLRWMSGTFGSRMRAIAADLDFYELMEPRGLSVAQLDRCLSNEARAIEIARISDEQGRLWAITGTPSFVLDGKLLPDAHDWAGVRAALGGTS